MIGSRRSRTDAAPLQNNKATNMNKKTIITALLALVALTGRGQTDTKGGILSGIETDVQPFDFCKPMMVDSLRFHQSQHLIVAAIDGDTCAIP